MRLIDLGTNFVIEDPQFLVLLHHIQKGRIIV